MYCKVRAAVVLTLLLSAAGAWSQVIYSQPYTAPLASFESRVQSCTTFSPIVQVAMDDWISPAAGSPPIGQIRWWGTVTNFTQIFRPYLIAIYLDNGNCRPDVAAGPVYMACVQPTGDTLGQDCQGRMLAIFFANIPPFAPAPNTHYWFQISEVDDQSVRPGKVDFRWSAHRPIMNCFARKWKASGAMPKCKDPCDNLFDDLAFELSM